MHSVRHRCFALYSKNFIRTKVLTAATLTTVSTLMPWLLHEEPVALADVTPTVSSIATETVNFSREVSALSPTVSQSVRGAAQVADWNTVLFGQSSPTAQQVKIMNQVAPSLKSLLTFNTASDTLATSEVTTALQAIQTLSPSLLSRPEFF